MKPDPAILVEMMIMALIFKVLISDYELTKTAGYER